MKKELSLFKDRVSIPTYHKEDDIYIKHCVDCGKKVVKYNVDRSDYHRNERGEIVFKEKGMTVILNGKRCRSCSAKIILHIEDYYN